MILQSLVQQLPALPILNKKMKKFLASRIRSFKYAFKGISRVVKTQANMRIHLLATIVVVAVACCLGISLNHWLILVLTISMVLAAEMFNTAIESLCDAVT
jgi:diacylglycerol kinase